MLNKKKDFLGIRNIIIKSHVLLSFVKNNLDAIFYKLYYRNKKRNQNLWVFGEWFGDKCCDNALFFANFLAKKHPHVKLVWISKKETDLSRLDISVHRMVMDSEEAISTLKKAGVVFYVQGFMDVTATNRLYYSGALVVNLWHGVPWKKIGTDICKDSRAVYGMEFYNRLYGADWYLASSKEFARILVTAYRLEDDCIVKTGYPRNSLFYSPDHVRQCRERLAEFLSSNCDVSVNVHTRFILYMPTFRDTTNEAFTFRNVSGIEDFLASENVVLLQKSHYVTSKKVLNLEHRKGNRIFDINNNLISQELLAASDVLITDYSSCFFDFLLLDRPIIHFLYDYRYYCSVDRGLYYKKEEVACGNVVENTEDLVSALKENLDNPKKYSILRKERCKKFIGFESQNSCEHIYNKVYSYIATKWG